MGLKRFVSDAEDEGLVEADWREVPERHSGGWPMMFWLLFLGGCAALLLIGMSALTVGVVP